MQQSFKYLLLILSLGACRPGTENSQKLELRQEASQNPRENSIEAHRAFLQKEIESIKAYIADRDLDLERNGTGIYYSIDSTAAQGPMAKEGDLVYYYYSISMLNGSQLYQSDSSKPASLLIDREDAEIGLHDALKLMRVGDKGFFILPSHRAFGVGGDQNKVPPFTALVYKLEVLEIQNQNQQK
ncbi:FKBP-type peptidyl-prolyl cis-trans isomerase [Croceimicrobium sp.]|uniref:FKBP-type peptidyl-prolyl cis-trans isomerase n=1 Tax=Croceimicrobium sp. TaxID=2828340 RepID=UPI003BAA12A0